MVSLITAISVFSSCGTQKNKQVDDNETEVVTDDAELNAVKVAIPTTPLQTNVYVEVYCSGNTSSIVATSRTQCTGGTWEKKSGGRSLPTTTRSSGSNGSGTTYCRAGTAYFCLLTSTGGNWPSSILNKNQCMDGCGSAVTLTEVKLPPKSPNPSSGSSGSKYPNCQSVTPFHPDGCYYHYYCPGKGMIYEDYSGKACTPR